MNRARDSQRSKVYTAEWATERGKAERRFDEMSDLKARTKQIVESKWWRDRIRFRRTVTVKDGRGRRLACADSWDFSISLPRHQRNDWVLIHELAHLLADNIHGRRIAAHGREFCMEYLALTRRFRGKAAHDDLKASFKKHGVKYRPKVQLSQEERQRRRQRALENLRPAAILVVE